MVLLANGEEVPIKDIKPGTYVSSYDLENKEITSRKVINVISQELDKEWCKLVFEDREIICTKDHKFFTKNRGWIEAWNLTEDDEFVKV
jgi:DNA polymerase-3 subunit alpha